MLDPWELEYLDRALVERGHSLEHIGIRSLAWTREDAIAVVEQLSAAGGCIVGGDVYYGDISRPTLAPEIWSINKLPTESFGAYIERGRQLSVDFIRDWQSPDGTEPYFDIVSGGQQGPYRAIPFDELEE